MYHNVFFVADKFSEKAEFHPKVVSVYKILTDENYYHICDEEECSQYSGDTLCFVRCVTGSGKIYLTDGAITLSAGDYAVLRFADIVKYKSASNIFAYRWVNFTLQSGDESDIKSLGKIIHTAQNDEEEHIFEKLLLMGKSTINGGYINSLFAAYYYNITCRDELADTGQDKIYSSKQIYDISTYIEQKVFGKLTVSELSAFFGISQRRLHQIFTKELGISPKQYILKKKMEEGYRLLVQTSMPINKIAEALCFSSQYHFTNEFKKTFSQTPTQLRNMEK